MSSREERQQSFYPLAILLLFALIILLIGVLNHVDESKWNGLGREESSQPDKRGDDLARQRQELAHKKDLSADSRKLRTSLPPALPPADRIKAEAEGQFPKTDDFTTSQPLELALLQEPGEIVGWVTDTKSLPVSGALVKLKFEKEMEGGKKTPKLEAHSNESGLFLLPKVPPGVWAVIAEKDNFATAVATGIEVLSRERPSPVILRMEPEIRVKGVVKAGEQPVANATVVASRDHLSVHGTNGVESVRIIYSDVYTNDKGEFELDKLAAGPMQIRVKAVGFVPVERKIEVKDKMEPIEIKLVSESLLIGTVRSELGNPIAGAEVILTLPDATTPEKPHCSTKSEKNGGFILRELPGNQKFNLFAKAEGYAAYGPDPVASGTTTNVIIMQTGGAIEGKVTDFADGKPVAGIGVVAFAENAPVPVQLWSKTNAEGEYRIGRLPTGNYNVSIFSDQLTSEPRLGVQVNGTTPIKGMDFVVYPGITVTGMVIDGVTSGRIPNAKVSLKSRVGPGLLMTKNTEALTDESGSFRFENLPQGLYDLTADATGYVRGVGEESSVRVEAVRGSIPDPAEIKLYRGGTIEGLVVDPRGSPVNEALVQIFHATGSPTRIKAEDFKATTNSQGGFLIEGIPLQGELHLHATAWATGYGKERSEVIILSREQNIKSTEIVLGDGVEIIVEARDPLGDGIADVALELVHSRFPGDAAPPAWKQETGGDGNALFEKVPSGKITVSAARQGYLTATGSLDVDPEESLQRLKITMQPAFVLAGRVQDDMIQPVRGGRVNARPERGAKGSGTSPINADSTFRIETLGDGTFNLEAIVQMNTTTGGRQITWSFPNQIPNGGAAETVLTVPMNGALEGRVLVPDGDAVLKNFTVSLSANYKDDAERRQGFNAAFTFDKSNEFRFDYLPPGEYRLTVTAPNYLPVTDGPFDVVSPGVFSVGTIKLNPGGSLKYRVVDSRTGEPIVTAVGKLNPEGPSAKSDGEGKTLMTPVKPGIYTLELTHGEYLPRKVPLVQITRGKETDEGVIEIDPGATLFGKVTDGDGEAVRGLLVEARAQNDDVTRRTNTDQSGNYTLKGLVPGGQVVTYSGLVNTRKLSKSLDLSVSAEEDTEQDVELWANSQLDGVLVAAPDVDLRRSVVTLYPLRADNFPQVTDPVRVSDILNDKFRAMDLIEGYYLVSVQAPGTGGRLSYWADVAPVFARNNQATVREGSIQLNGRIINKKTGAAVPSQDVRLDLLSSTQSGVIPLRRWWQWSAKTDAQGSFTLGKLPAGTYSLVAYNDKLRADILEVITVGNDQKVVSREFGFE